MDLAGAIVQLQYEKAALIEYNENQEMSKGDNDFIQAVNIITEFISSMSEDARLNEFYFE